MITLKQPSANFDFKKLFAFGILVCGLYILNACNTESTRKNSNELYSAFQHPDAEAKPMVRWWWVGNAVEADEIKRELAVMSDAGIGGIEINSIAMPPTAKNIGQKELEWAGSEWCNMVKVASLEAKELGMITDLIVGSGWPFGGKFLEKEDIIQKLGVKEEFVAANSQINIDFSNFLKFRRHNDRGSKEKKKNSDVELLSVKLMPLDVNNLESFIDISSHVKDNKLSYKVDNKDYLLVVLYNERDFKSVYFGSPGADGPIMDHYKEEVVMKYLNRLKVLAKETGMTLDQLLRALFCDSIELGGSNWTDDMAALFKQQNGYDVTPYLPLILLSEGENKEYKLSADLAETLSRVKYDYFNTIIKVFLERFTTNFKNFCTDNGVLCRYQAYGTPYYMGLFQGYLIPDIPESNNWIYSGSRDEAANPEFSWTQGHGYMLWNKATSSGGHIMGRNIISNEAMTNVNGVFRTSLETIKQCDDLNFITGTNHSVLHGYSYSPPEAGFPGWIRYGSFFNEKNTWWKYFKNWAGYNARLSSVFQNSKPTADIAILGRLRDTWAENSPKREYFNSDPWYYSRLWEPISNLGSSCDYLSQPSIEQATIEGNALVCGYMRYKVVILTELNSITPPAAVKLKQFAEAGGKIVFVGNKPYRSLSFKDAEENDNVVGSNMEAITSALEIAAPEKNENLLAWVQSLMKKIDLAPHVTISKPESRLYSMKQYLGEQELYFFTNSDRTKPISFEATFPVGNKVPYIWFPETGERKIIEVLDNKKLQITLDALESALIVYSNQKLNLPKYQFKSLPNTFTTFDTEWEVKFDHINGSDFTKDMASLIDFKNSKDPLVRNFAGTITYTGILNSNDEIEYIKLSDVNEAVSELIVNGEKIGMKWYGNHCYDVSKAIRKGENKIEIILTNTLANYCASLKDDETAMFWTKFYESPVSSGLVGVEFSIK